MSDLASILLSRGFLKVLYAGTCAFVHFSFRPQHTLLRIGRRKNSRDPAISSTPAGDAWRHDTLDYLGKINLGYVALATLRLVAVYRVSKSTLQSVESKELDMLALRSWVLRMRARLGTTSSRIGSAIGGL